MNENDSSGGKWAQNIALFLIAAVAIIILLFWFTNKSGKEKADLAASVQKLYGQIECITPQINKYAERVDAIGVGLAKVAQAQSSFQQTASAMLADLDNTVYVPRYDAGRCGNHNCCGSSSKFVKSTPYTAGATTVEETVTCQEC